MVYLNIILGVLTVVVSAGLALYLSRPNYQHQPPHQTHRRDEEKTNQNDGRPNNKFESRKYRKSMPGDRCPCCTEEMPSDDMHRMQCGHALHYACFQEFRYLRPNCLVCDKTVNLTMPGDQCIICFDLLTKDEMHHLKCHHALHKVCASELKATGALNCPICRASM
ncbi:E3 ubiquitin-protein ligase AIRP1 [Drosophila guanche]|uniref:E3 ubiquitin-protein ligase AIRP1 n=1 Tax=Drosophila guanche TaxID=7266 RepID=UPI0014718528|nr:E3 ubiquitin-protein ligase AIRP1 [Drosophila guanche]